MTMQTENFYQKISSFSDFSGISDAANFSPVPKDWMVVITDVKGSTQAIQDGRYKDVNTLGAAAIACVQNAVGDLEYPFVFGGDGATLVVPKSAIENVIYALSGLKALASQYFSLGLRVGVVPVAELIDGGIQLEVAKFRLIGKKTLAVFSGGGLTEAERRVKESHLYEIVTIDEGQADLTGLSCRWHGIPSRHGKILSLLVVARTENPNAVYRDVLEAMNVIFSGHIGQANPVQVEQLTYHSLWKCLRDERRFHDSIWTRSFLSRVFGIFVAMLIFKYNVPQSFIDAKSYTDSIKTHSDFRKFDDALRMVVDCSRQQIDAIRDCFETLHREQKIYYGLFESDMSLMTCYVHEPSAGNHVHFVDGADGGYAMAAKQLKAQMKF